MFWIYKKEWLFFNSPLNPRNNPFERRADDKNCYYVSIRRKKFPFIFVRNKDKKIEIHKIEAQIRMCEYQICKNEEWTKLFKDGFNNFIIYLKEKEPLQFQKITTVPGLFGRPIGRPLWGSEIVQLYYGICGRGPKPEELNDETFISPHFTSPSPPVNSFSWYVLNRSSLSKQFSLSPDSPEIVRKEELEWRKKLEYRYDFYRVKLEYLKEEKEIINKVLLAVKSNLISIEKNSLIIYNLILIVILMVLFLFTIIKFIKFTIQTVNKYLKAKRNLEKDVFSITDIDKDYSKDPKINLQNCLEIIDKNKTDELENKNETKYKRTRFIFYCIFIITLITLSLLLIFNIRIEECSSFYIPHNALAYKWIWSRSFNYF